MQHVGIIRAFVCLGDLLSFSVPRWMEKIAGLWFARREGSVPRLALCKEHFSIKVTVKIM